jgi:adenosine deaminase
MDALTSCKKVELHIHLEGAASPLFVRDTCQSTGKEIPKIFTKSGAYNWESFDEFLKIYEVVTNLFLTDRCFESLIRHVLDNQVRENVIYTEIFLGPHLWSNKPSEIWQRFLKIASKVADEYQQKHGIYVYFIIVCIRHLGPEKALEAAEFASKVKMFRVVGFGMAGDEKQFDTLQFKESFNVAKNGGLGLTSHAGEICGPKTVDDTLELGVTRIGHGIRSIENEETVNKLLEKNIMLEICPASNIALGLYPSLGDHPIAEFFNRKLPISISTDDPPFFSTSLSKEYKDLHELFGWGPEIFNKINRQSLEFAFCDRQISTKLLKQLESGKINEKLNDN